MIDVLFLLLIFFVITWNFARDETEIEISVPAADQGKENHNRNVGEIVINVRKTGEIVVEKHRADIRAVGEPFKTLSFYL